MVRPRYMICSEARVVDRDNGLVTFYNVLDQLTIIAAKPTSKPAVPPMVKFVVTSTWMRETDEESEETYEFETDLHVPWEDNPRRVHSGQFQFGANRSYRLEVFVHGFGVPPTESPTEGFVRFESGMLRLVSRVRRSGDREWLSQDCLIPVRAEQMAGEFAQSSRNSSEE